MKRMYMYPMKAIHELREKHPYQYNLVTNCTRHFAILNYGKSPRGGIKDIRHYFFQSDILYFNWIENLTNKREIGKFLLFFFSSKLFKKKIVWAHHNIHPHHGDTKLSQLLIRYLSRYSDYVVIHTKESLKLLGLKEHDKRILYFFHPFFVNAPDFTDGAEGKKFDLLIWGSMRGSKGVGSFFEYLKTHKKLDDYRIKVVGKFESVDAYDDFITSYRGKQMSFENRYASEAELVELHKAARFIFFPYTGTSVLNSGALINSVPKGTRIIGPNAGAFKELGEMGIVDIYHDFADVLKYISSDEKRDQAFEMKVTELCKHYSWQNFASFLAERIK